MMIYECKGSTSKIKWEQSSAQNKLLATECYKYHFAFEFILSNLQAKPRLTDWERERERGERERERERA